MSYIYNNHLSFKPTNQYSTNFSEYEYYWSFRSTILIPVPSAYWSSVCFLHGRELKFIIPQPVSPRSLPIPLGSVSFSAFVLTTLAAPSTRATPSSSRPSSPNHLGLAWDPPASRSSQSHTVVLGGLGKPCLYLSSFSIPLLWRKLVLATAEEAGKPFEGQYGRSPMPYTSRDTGLSTACRVYTSCQEAIASVHFQLIGFQPLHTWEVPMNFSWEELRINTSTLKQIRLC